MDDLAHLLEARAHGLALQVSVVDALENHRQLEGAEPEVEAEIGEVAAAAAGVPLQHLLLGEEPGRRRRIGDRAAPRQLPDPCVEHEKCHVGEWVTEGGHLPVDDRGHPVAVIGEHVVEPVVAVHDAGRLLLGHRRGQPVVQLVCRRQVTAVRRVELLLPPPDLALEIALGTAEVGQAHRARVDLVQRGQRVDQPLGDSPRRLGPELLEIRGAAVRRALDPLHHVERGTEHVGVLAERERPWHRHRGLVQSAHHPVLAGHVVSGGQHVAQRRAPHDPALGAVGDLVGEVGPATGDQRRGELGVGHRRDHPGEPFAETGEVEDGRFITPTGSRLLARMAGHHATRTLSVSATQAGLSPPSRSTVTRAVSWWPAWLSRSWTSSTPARTREPTGTGEGKRTLLAP
jgi:hypothetical protein